MCAKRAEKVYRPHRGVRRPVCPERISYQAGGLLVDERLVDSSNTHRDRNRRGNRFSRMETQKRSVSVRSKP